jgi:hypothetical protein
MNRRTLRLESLESRLTPATKGAPILPPPTISHGAAQVIVINHLPTSGSSSGQGMNPMIGIPFGNSGSSGSGNSGGSGLGTSTGDPVGPGPGN